MHSARVDTVLLLDDDLPTLRAWTRAFTARGCTVQAVANLDAARRAVRDQPPDLALIDLYVDSESGLDLLRDLRVVSATTIVVVTSGQEDLGVREAYKLGASQVLPKPVPILRMLDWIERGGPKPDTPTLARAIAEHRLEVVAACGSIREAARVLGVSRTSLQRQLDHPIPARKSLRSKG